MIIAKPVIDKQFWILKQNDQKVGNIQVASDGTYEVKILDYVNRYKTIPMLRKAVGVEFEPAEKKSRPATNSVHGYETGCKAHNSMWDVKHRLPLFTKTAKSKSWFAAGYYWVKQHRSWKVMPNPKLILLERYPYQGPYHTKEEANNESVS